MEPSATIDGLVGVYHADGGVIGEAKYVIGKILGTAHCALCDITHSPVRRKPAWDRMVADLGIPFTLLHLNEMDTVIAAAAAQHGSPVVVARLSDGTVAPVLLPTELERLDGSVQAFALALQSPLQALQARAGAQEERIDTSIAPGTSGRRTS